MPTVTTQQRAEVDALLLCRSRKDVGDMLAACDAAAQDAKIPFANACDMVSNVLAVYDARESVVTEYYGKLQYWRCVSAALGAVVALLLVAMELA